MAKAFYGLDMRGKFLVERRTSNPAAEEGRVFLRTDTNAFYGSPDGTNNRRLVIEDGGTYGIDISGNAATATSTTGTAEQAKYA